MIHTITKSYFSLKGITKLSVLTLLLCCHFSPISSAWAEPYMQVQVIEASKEKKPMISKELRAISSALQASFTNYNHYQYIKGDRFDLKDKRVNKLNITNGLDFLMKVELIKGNAVTLKVNIPEKKMKHTVNAKLGKLFFEALKWKGKVYLIAFLPRD